MPRDSSTLHAASDAQWQQAARREAVIRPLAHHPRLTAAAVLDAAQQLGLSRATVYRLIARYRERPATTSLVLPRPGPTAGQRRLPTAVEDLIQAAIAEVYATRQKPTVAALLRHVQQACRSQGLPAPSFKALKARVDGHDPKALVKAREGAKAARDRFGPVRAEYVADHALQVVQIDHTKVDLIVVDAVHRRPIGRPWLTLAIDVASRMVAGFYLTLEAPSALSVALALSHALLPKDAWLAERGITASWPVAGLPEVVHSDNGKEFHSKAVSRACREYGITLEYRPPRTPHYGGHIERLIGTMMVHGN